jgi:hypothetical protein
MSPIKLSFNHMKWYNYVACFFSGVFLVNIAPHLVHGIDGDYFPTPFGNVLGTVPTSPIVNILWAMLNLVIGFSLLRAGKASMVKNGTLLCIFLGVLLYSLSLAALAPTVLADFKSHNH